MMLVACARERRAFALLPLGFYSTIFALAAINLGGAWFGCFFALALVYGVAFFALAAGWFWGRWFSMGVGLSGVTMAAIGVVKLGLDPGILLWGGLHLLIYLPLLGEAMADLYENQTAWRERYGMDDSGVARLKRAVGSAATSLPPLIMFTLAPRQASLVPLAALALAALGSYGLLRLRFWGVALLGASAAVLVLSMAWPIPSHGLAGIIGLHGSFGLAAAGLLALSAMPFIGPAYRFVSRG